MKTYKLKNPTLMAEKWNPDVEHPAITMYKSHNEGLTSGRIGVLQQQGYTLVVHEGDYVGLDKATGLYFVSPPQLFEGLYEEVETPKSKYSIMPCANTEFVDGRFCDHRGDSVVGDPDGRKL